MNNKNICFFNGNRAWGGGEKWHHDTSLAFKEKGYSVLVMADCRSELYTRFSKQAVTLVGVRVANLSFLNIFKVLKIACTLRKHKTDAIILNLSSDVKAAGIAAKLAGVSKIVYRRGLAVPVRNHLLNRFLFKHVITEVIANSEEIKRTILYHNPQLIAEKKIHVVYNGIAADEYRPEPIASARNNSDSAIVLGNAGRFVEQKGQKYLIETAALLKKKGIKFKLLIAGTGPLENRVKQYAKELNVADCIDFLGFVENMDDFMGRIDVFLLTSVHEGSAHTVLEAMAYRKPVVAFNISSNPEMIVDNHNGFLVDFPNVTEFAQRLLALISDPLLRKRFGAAGHQTILKKFDATKNLDRVISIIDQ
jgi:glycosyltransferase involved in cell wall biosynthesis